MSLKSDTVGEAFIAEHKPVFDLDTLLHAIGRARKWYWSDAEREKFGRMHLIEARRGVVAEAFRMLGIADESLARQTADRYSRLQEESLCLMDGAYEALETVRALGIRMALITNGTTGAQRGKLARFNLAHFFECVMIDEETGYSKPDARMYQLALKEMSLSPADCWMVGDNLVWDVQGAQQVGICAVWNDYRKKGLPEGSEIMPDKIVYSIEEMAREMVLATHPPL